MCLSCAMRGEWPRWVDVSGGMVLAWRGKSISQVQLAELSGIAQPNIVRIEQAKKIRAATAAKLVTGLVRSAALGNNLSQLMRDWPLFPLLVDPDVVESISPNVEIPGDLGDA